MRWRARPVVLFPALIAQKQGAKLVMDWADLFGRGGSVEERPNPLLRTILRPLRRSSRARFRTRADGSIVIKQLPAAAGNRSGGSARDAFCVCLTERMSKSIRPDTSNARRVEFWAGQEVPRSSVMWVLSSKPTRQLMAAGIRSHPAGPAEGPVIAVGYFNQRGSREWFRYRKQSGEQDHFHSSRFNLTIWPPVMCAGCRCVAA